MILAALTTVFGLTFGQPLALPECVRNSITPSIYEPVQPVTCQRMDGRGGPAEISAVRVVFPPDSAPSLVHEDAVDVYLVNNALGGIEYETIGIEDQQLVLDQLTAKFGRPDHLERPAVQNRAGAAFTAIRATWSKPDMFVEYQSAPVRLDLRFVSIETPAVKALRDAFYKRQADQRTPL